VTPLPDADPPRGETSDRELEVAQVDRLLVDGLELVVISEPIAPAPDALTDAEREVTRLVLEGLSNREIAERRGTSQRTVANQLRAIYQKLDVSSRYELAARLDQDPDPPR
jgi:DNA-binding NarL/FixJ family response regulator